MKHVFDRYPVDTLCCLLYSILVLPFVLFDINETFRIILCLPYILFIPGYLLLSCLFPQNNLNGGLDPVEKTAFSFGLSLALIPLVGIGLYYLPFGLRLQPILLSILLINLISGIFAIFRWYKTPIQERFKISIRLTPPKSKTNLDRILSVLLILIIISIIIIAIFVVISPRKQEKLTEFYILGPTGKATDYPLDFSKKQDLNITIGLINHEHKTMNYTIEIWLINQTFFYNTTTSTNDTIYHEMWFLDKLSVRLDYLTYYQGQLWKPQWEYLYNFHFNKTGRYTLTFLLYTSPTPEYQNSENYSDICEEKIQSSYENIYLWLNIKK